MFLFIIDFELLNFFFIFRIYILYFNIFFLVLDFVNYTKLLKKIIKLYIIIHIFEFFFNLVI